MNAGNSYPVPECTSADGAAFTLQVNLSAGDVPYGLLTPPQLARAHSPGPEVLLFRVLGLRGMRRLNLADERTWLLHPNKETPAYLELLRRLLESVAAGRVPDVQRGQSEIDVPAWQAFLH